MVVVLTPISPSPSRGSAQQHSRVCRRHGSLEGHKQLVRRCLFWISGADALFHCLIFTPNLSQQFPVWGRRRRYRGESVTNEPLPCALCTHPHNVRSWGLSVWLQPPLHRAYSECCSGHIPKTGPFSAHSSFLSLVLRGLICSQLQRPPPFAVLTTAFAAAIVLEGAW